MSHVKRQPWLRFYTADWRGDAGLRAVGYAARGLWIDMLSLMHEATPYGHLVLNGQPLDAARIAARLGGAAKEVQALLDRLEAENVFSRTPEGVIFSRRMVADAIKAALDREHGKKGGNSALTPRPKDKAEDTPPDNGGGGSWVNGGVNPQDKAHARTCAPVPLPVPEKKDSVPSGTDAEVASACPSPADLLWSVGVPILKRLTSKSDGQCRAMLGKMRRDVQDDCPRLLLILQEAASAQHVDPVAWLTAATSGRKSGESASDRRIREQRETMHRLVYGEDEPVTIDQIPDRSLLQ